MPSDAGDNGPRQLPKKEAAMLCACEVAGALALS